MRRDARRGLGNQSSHYTFDALKLIILTESVDGILALKNQLIAIDICLRKWKFLCGLRHATGHVRRS